MASADILRAAHAALPYAACDGEENVIVNIVDGKANHYVATCHAGAAPDLHGVKTAAFIVRACNAHYQMLEALKWFIDDIDGSHTSMTDFDANVVRARAAIAAAETEAAR